MPGLWVKIPNGAVGRDRTCEPQDNCQLIHKYSPKNLFTSILTYPNKANTIYLSTIKPVFTELVEFIVVELLSCLETLHTQSNSVNYHHLPNPTVT